MMSHQKKGIHPRPCGIINLSNIISYGRGTLPCLIEKTTFEVNGWDVYMHLGFPYNVNIFLELKPSVGDDYPSVLREMKVHKNYMSQNEDVIHKNYYVYGCYGRERTKDYYILVYKNLTTSTISESELAEYFNSCDFEVVKI